MLLDLSAAVSELESAELPSISDDELRSLLPSLRELENRLERVATRLAGELDARSAHTGDGSKSAAAWLAFHARMPHGAAHRRVRLAREVRSMPAVDAAWACGAVESAHVSALARARNERTASAFARGEEMLVDPARTMRFDDFRRVLAYWSQGADPDGVEQDARELREQRHAHLSPTFGGAWVLDGLFDPIGGAIIDATLRAIDDELYLADQQAGAERTSAQRRAAFVEMAARARTAPRDGRRPAPLFSVLVGYETADSTGECKELGELLRWFQIAERLAWPVVQRSRDASEVFGCEQREISSFGHVLAEEPVGVLVGAALPGGVRVAEVDLDPGFDGEGPVECRRP